MRATAAQRSPRSDEVLVVEGSLRISRGAAAARRGDRRARREGPAARPRAGRRHADRRLPRRPGPLRRTSSTTSPASTASSSSRSRRPRRRRRRSCGTPSRRAGSLRRCGPAFGEWGMERLYDEVELPLTAVLADMEDAGIRIDTYRMGEITARLAERVEELEASALDLAGEEFQLGSTAAARADPVREARAHGGPQGEDGLLDRRARAARDPRRPRDRAGRRGVARADEAPQHVPAAAPGADRRARRPAAHDDQPGRRRDGAALDDEPEPPVDPRSAPSSGGGSARRSSRRRDAAAVGRLQPGRAAHPRARLRRAGAARGVRARRGHPRGDGVAGVRHPAGRAHARPARHGEDGQLRDHLRDLVLRSLREPRHPARGGAGADRHVPRAAARSCRSSSSGRSPRRPPTATSRRCSGAAARSPSSAPPTGRRGRSASGSPSTP